MKIVTKDRIYTAKKLDFDDPKSSLMKFEPPTKVIARKSWLARAGERREMMEKITDRKLRKLVESE